MGVTKLSFLKSKLISADIIFDFEKEKKKKFKLNDFKHV